MLPTRKSAGCGQSDRAASTLDRYADLFPDDLDQVAEALNLARKNLTKT